MTQNIFQEYLSEKRIEGSLRSRLEAYAPDKQEALAAFLALGPSANTLQEVLRLAEEVSARDKTAFASVMQSQELLSILAQDGSNRKLKQKLFRQELFDKRYPALKQIRDTLSEHQNVIRKDCGLRIALPEDFEGDTVTFEVSARSTQDLEKLAQQVEQLSKHPSARAVFDILGGRDQ